MIVNERLSTPAVIRGSWRFLVLSGSWALLVVGLNDLFGWSFVVVPLPPVATLGIVVSLYLGFKSSSSYDRWWEARKLWGTIVNESRTWATAVEGLIPDQADPDRTIRTRMTRRHLAWVYALAYQLRKTSRHPPSDTSHVFGRRLADTSAYATRSMDTAKIYLSDEDWNAVKDTNNPAVHIVSLQADEARRLLSDGIIDNNRLVQITNMLGRLYDSQGGCERIKNAPFPRQITHFGRLFTYLFIILTPLALITPFESVVTREAFSGVVAHEFVFTLVPFTVIVTWLFYMFEMVSESCEDPFEWGPTDVPVAAIARTIEIDLLQMMGERDVPEPVAPRNGILY